MYDENLILGVDIGGTGIKGAIVNVLTGELLAERKRIMTPQPATPKKVAKAFAELVSQHDWVGRPIGCGFPAITSHGIIRSAANISEKWMGKNAEKILSKASGCPVSVVNDADAAGEAIMNFGIGRGRKGLVLVLTLGTGIGSALFHDGVLVPNTELGHLYLSNGLVAEHYAADSVRRTQELSWEEWGTRFNSYLQHIQRLFSPDCIILGGGGSKYFDEYKTFLHLDNVEILAATLLNAAGTIGAAWHARQVHNLRAKLVEGQ